MVGRARELIGLKRVAASGEVIDWKKITAQYVRV